MGFYELAEKAFELERSGKKLIRLNVGDTNLPTPQCAVDAAIHSMSNSKSGYVSAAGLPKFREKIAERENCDIDNVVVGPGSKLLLYGLLTILGKGRVAFPSPHWSAYELICNQLDIPSEILPTTMENNWNFDPIDFNKLKKSGVRTLIICNPLNPTSTIYDHNLMQETLAHASEYGVNVILDEAYRGLAFEPLPNYTSRESVNKNVMTVRSFSKEFNMEGWRLGYAIAPKEVAKKLVKFMQISTTCVAPFVQSAGLACLENESEILKNNKKIWFSRLEVAQSELRKAGFVFAPVQAGIYLFFFFSSINEGNADQFALSLLDQGVVVAPGSGFGNYKNFLRICVNQHEDKLKEAIEKICAVL
ncbi:pyridoxal phosphate-dependent aminotransferase [Candidatus Micrarchaeota archaeon]|nr:pyridoxal phosphate-dependent aminotransferase [Candidatus Micrarchaeota archaeon]